VSCLNVFSDLCSKVQFADILKGFVEFAYVFVNKECGFSLDRAPSVWQLSLTLILKHPLRFSILLSLQRYVTAISFISTIINDLLASARMPSLTQLLDYTKGNSVDGKDVDGQDGDKASDIYEECSSVNQSKQFSTKQNMDPQATITPPSSTPPMTPLAQAKSTLTVVNPSAVESRRLRKRSGQTNDPIDTTMQQIQIETALPSHGRWPELFYDIVQTFLSIFRNPFFVPLCLVLALLYLIPSFRVSLVEFVDTVQSAGRAIGSCFGFTWQYADAWMQSVWNIATTSVYQMVSTGADVTNGAMNKTSVAVCSHYFGWLILTNLGLDCPFSAPYQPLDKKVGDTLNNATLGMGQLANTAVKLLPYGRQLTWSEIWLRHTSYTILESDLIDKNLLSELCLDYTDEIATIGEEVTALASGINAHLNFQRLNLQSLQGQIEQDDRRIWWFRLFHPKELYIRDQYLDFIETADEDLLRVLESGSLCIKLIRECQHTSGKIQKTLQHNRNMISEQGNDRGILSRWLRKNENLSRKTNMIDNMDAYLDPVLDLIGSILDKVQHVRAELSTLSSDLKRGHTGSTSPQLMVQIQIISSAIKRLQHARDGLLKGRQEEEARHQQQLKDKTLRYKPL
jgi:hypothetical protein